MLALHLALSVGRKVLTAGHERQLRHPKRLGVVAKAVLFLEWQERIHHRIDPDRLLEVRANSPPTQLALSPISCIPIT